MKKAKKKGRFLAWIFGVLTLCLLLVLAGGIWLQIEIQNHYSKSIPKELFDSPSAPPTFYFYSFSNRSDRIGERVALTSENQVHATATLSEMPESLKAAAVAIEDKRFYSHDGVDWFRTASAGVHYLFGSRNFGGSTITQQLVKNVTGETDPTPSRKVQEILYALDLETKMSKEEILERYLNILPLSDGCVGVEEGAEHYFSKTVGELTPAECASIIAVTNNPSYYNPITHPENNLSRRNLILREMQRQGMMSEEDCALQIASPLNLNPTETDPEHIRSWYLDMVLDDVTTDFCETYGITRAQASQKLLHEGLQIEIAMDETCQKIVETYYENSIRMPQNANGEQAQSALILIDPKTGDILAVAGAVGQKTANRVQNFATQALRSPGSSIKPITVYAPALENGTITWASVFDDTPLEFVDENTRTWPKNADGSYRGLTTVAYAVAHSTNTVALRVLEASGRENAFETAKNRFHLSHLIENEAKNDTGVAALGLGQLQKGLPLRELTAAYTVFADGGCYHPTRSYYRVLDRDGRILLSNSDRSERVISAENAAVMTKLLQGVVQNGTSSSVTLNAYTECAGKTGTTQNDNDRWFIGYTPELLCGVWCGYEYPEPLIGRNLCTGVWNDVMTRIYAQTGGKTSFSIPENVIRAAYCADSGKCICHACGSDPRGDREEIGWFVRGTEPKENCDRHVLVRYDEKDGVSHGFCTGEHTKFVSLIRVERNFPIQVTVADAQYVYRGSPYLIRPNSDSSQAYFEATLSNFCGRSETDLPFNRSCTQHKERIPIPWQFGQADSSAPETSAEDGKHKKWWARIF